ncbi:MAG: hypothetical protein KatS3mg061_2245 [Dehalococcoidia bacterium]|nr:MAG: hypothetical protein KatS3mg061_2245 [Dehalococcoidia bacterium]
MTRLSRPWSPLPRRATPTATADLVERFRPLLLSLCRGQPEREDLFQEAVCQLLELIRDL